MRTVLTVVLLLNLASLGPAQDIVPSSWYELGGSASGDGISGIVSARHPTMALDASGQPVVAWTQATPSGVWIYVRRWDGTAWVEFGGSGSGSGIWPAVETTVNYGPCLALDGAGNPTVVFKDSGIGNWEIHLVRWNGSAWQELGGSATGGGVSNFVGISREPAVAVTSSGNPCVAWVEDEGIHVRRWTGSAWESLSGLGAPYVASGIASSPSLSINAIGQPVLAWSHLVAAADVSSPPQSELRAKRWNGSGWVSFDGTADGNAVTPVFNTTPTRVSMVLDGSGFPVVAWEAPVGGADEIYVRRWNGLSWIELGGSGSGGGVSNSATWSTLPSIALGTGGQPIVAWTEQPTGSFGEIYVRRWNGFAWIELDGSASGGGISASASAGSGAPTVAAAAAGPVHVGWEENGRAYLRYRSGEGVEALAQFQPDGTTPIAVGGPATQAAAILRGVPLSNVPSSQVRFQVELRPVGIAFTGTPTAESDLVASGMSVDIPVTLTGGVWHWAARAMPDGGAPTVWIPYGGNAEGDADLTVTGTIIIIDPAPPADDGGGGGKGCGLLGIEWAFLLLFRPVIRGRRAVLLRSVFASADQL